MDKKVLLWLDDQRNPFLDEEGKVPEGYVVHWVLNYEQFKAWIFNYFIPDAVSFDHDLTEEHYTPEYFWDNYYESKKYQLWKRQSYVHKTGYDCAVLLKSVCNKYDVDLPETFIHSANPVGADWIREVLEMPLNKHISELEIKRN